MVAHNGSGIAEGRVLAFLKLNKVIVFTVCSSATWYYFRPAFAIPCCTKSYSSILDFRSILWCKILTISMSPDFITR